MSAPFYCSEDIKAELRYFRRLHEHFTLTLGVKGISIKDAEDRAIYMAMTASCVMDTFEEGFFDYFVITDKHLTNKPELQLDAYAFIETDSPNERHLHLFQYKLHETPKHSASPVDVAQFATVMNNLFVHPELMLENSSGNPLFKEIEDKIQAFLNGSRNRRVRVKCHFISNGKGMGPNIREFESLLGRFGYDKQHFGFAIQVYGEKDIADLMREGKVAIGKETIKITVDSPYAYRYEDNSVKKGLGLPDKVLIASCNVNELLRLQNKYHHNELYSENIRLYLGDRAIVNKDIIKTITSEESLWFPYMNNGISIICDKMDLGSVNKQKQTMAIELANLQIINGCQTVNALYNARYHEDTADSFRSSTVLVKIYQIDPSNKRFKEQVIKAANNQNAVKTYSLLANDPIQREIQKKMKQLGFLYDRKGESKGDDKAKSIGMVQAALAYRAVFRLEAQKLRARIGASRVFQKDLYEEIYRSDYLENRAGLDALTVHLLAAALILDTLRALLAERSDQYASGLPVIKKSAYFLGGLYYAMHKAQSDTFMGNCRDILIQERLDEKRAGYFCEAFTKGIGNTFDDLAAAYRRFYEGVDLEKRDVDNLLKMEDFGRRYRDYIERKGWEAQL